MSTDYIVEIVAKSVMLIIQVSAPPLLAGLIVGIVVSIFQTITSIQEQTLAFVPKIVAVFLSLIIFGAWMLEKLKEFIHEVFTSFPL